MKIPFTSLCVCATGLSTSQPHHSGPGDPDRALSALDRPAKRGGRLPVLPQRPVPACLPLQGSPCPIRDPDCERLLPPESQHRKHHEVQTRRDMNTTDPTGCIVHSTEELCFKGL